MMGNDLRSSWAAAECTVCFACYKDDVVAITRVECPNVIILREHIPCWDSLKP
jgi:hypothetical protein